MRRVLVTGSSGFIGSCLCERLKSFDSQAHWAEGEAKSFFLSTSSQNIERSTDWKEVLSGVDFLVHTAARVHQLATSGSDTELAKYRNTNTHGTLRLAEQAAWVGVKRFIFLSSVKVNGEVGQEGVPYGEESSPNPQDPYAQSKYEAELGLWEISKSTGMEIVIIRPPLVYGPGVKANFLRMLHWVDMSLPLPIGAIHNKRSFIALDNLVDFIVTCIDHPAAGNQLFMVSDGHDLSTPELLRKLAASLGRPDRQFSLPEKLIFGGANLLGKKPEYYRLCGSLQVDISKAKTLLGWEPPLTVAAGLQKTAEWFIENKRKGFRL